MEVCADTDSKDICTTSTSWVSVRPCDNLAMRKSDKHTKTPSWFVNTKISLLLLYLSCRQEEQNGIWKLSQPCYLDKEKQNVPRKKSRNRLWIFLQVFLTGFVLTGLHLGMRPLFQTHPKMGKKTFGYLYIVMAGLQMLSLHHHIWLPTNSFSILRTLLTTFPFESPLANQNSLLICCWYISIFKPGILNYFTLLP